MKQAFFATFCILVSLGLFKLAHGWDYTMGLLILWIVLVMIASWMIWAVAGLLFAPKKPAPVIGDLLEETDTHVIVKFAKSRTK